jgi:hypothetical protein
VVYPSPFIEARTPVWQPNYALPSFLYCHMLTYPVGGTPYLLPFIPSPESERYAASIAGCALASSGKFVVYGGDTNVGRWQYFFSRRSELAGWHIQTLGSFGDVAAVVFENPDARLRGVATEHDYPSAILLSGVRRDAALQSRAVRHADAWSFPAAWAERIIERFVLGVRKRRNEVKAVMRLALGSEKFAGLTNHLFKQRNVESSP